MGISEISVLAERRASEKSPEQKNPIWGSRNSEEANIAKKKMRSKQAPDNLRP